MTPPLSILLPVHNAQATLAADVAGLLDVLPELTTWFELLIIDDGSTDATCEIAEELVPAYPQVRLVRHNMRRGVEGSWRVGLERSDAPIVLAHNGRTEIDPLAIVRLLKSQNPTPLEQTAEINGEHRMIDDNSRFVRWLSARAIADEAPAIGGFCLLRRESELPRPPKSNWRIERGHKLHTSRTTLDANQTAKPMPDLPPLPLKPAIKPRPVPSAKNAAPRPSFLAHLKSLVSGD